MGECGSMQKFTIEPSDKALCAFAHAHRALGDSVADRLGVCGRARDDPQKLGRGRLLLLSLRLALYRFSLALLCLRQAFLQVAYPGVLVLGRLPGNRWLCFIGLRGRWTPAHRPPLASYES